MTLVYHLTPSNMVGDTLHPLNRLQEIHPNIYEKQIQKYRGREQIIKRRIPILNCLWNDVLFFSNIHPKAIRHGFIAVGKQWKPQKWYTVNTTSCNFNEQNTVIYHPDMTRMKDDFALSPERFSAFDSDELETMNELPPANLAYYRESAERGEPIFAWHGLPHILHLGSVLIKNIEILEI